jgi:hypothetical protein
MRGMSNPLWSQCADIADFYFPSAPHALDASHPFCKQYGRRPGPNERTWNLNGGNRGDFADDLCSFIQTNVPGPVDVLLGYSQGGYAIHQLLGSADLPEQLRSVRAVVILMSGGDFKRSAPTKLRSLHIMGLKDKVVPNSSSGTCHQKYVDPIVAKEDVGHQGPFKPGCVSRQLEFLRGVHDFHSSFKPLRELEAE